MPVTVAKYVCCLISTVKKVNFANSTFLTTTKMNFCNLTTASYTVTQSSPFLYREWFLEKSDAFLFRFRVKKEYRIGEGVGMGIG
jgi:hypothetical protein